MSSEAQVSAAGAEQVVYSIVLFGSIRVSKSGCCFHLFPQFQTFFQSLSE